MFPNTQHRLKCAAVANCMLASVSRFLFFSPQREEFTEETIKLGGSWDHPKENLHIDSWMKRRSYDAFREIMESGVRHHLEVRTQALVSGNRLFVCAQFVQNSKYKCNRSLILSCRSTLTI